jgi:prolyl-tRNA synthetase
MYTKALEKLNSKQKEAYNWKDFMTELNNRNVVLTPWCESAECEEKVKVRSAI